MCSIEPRDNKKYAPKANHESLHPASSSSRSDAVRNTSQLIQAANNCEHAMIMGAVVCTLCSRIIGSSLGGTLLLTALIIPNAVEVSGVVAVASSVGALELSAAFGHAPFRRGRRSIWLARASTAG